MTPATPPQSVVRLITRLNIGGPARHAFVLSKGLAQRFPTVLASGRPSTNEGELSDADVPVVRLPLVRALSPARDARCILAVRRLVTTTRPAILHTHMAKAGSVGRTAGLSLRNRPLLVHTFHGHVLDGYFRPPVARAFIEVERRLARSTDVLIAVSDQTRAELLELGIGTPDQWRVIPLGLDLAAHRSTSREHGRLRTAIGIADDVPLVGIVGRLAPIKDVELALEVIRRVPGAHLAVVGDGPTRALLEARATTLGLERRVHFTGWWHDVPSAMADLDVVLLTSRSEGTPVALIEASACARPVVATDVGGVRAVVRDNETGFLHPHGDAEGLAASVTRLLAESDLAERLGRAGRMHATTTFAQERLVRDIGNLYDELLRR